MRGPVVVAFDLDGTLTRQDSMLAFLAYAAGRGRLYRALLVLLPRLLLMKLGCSSRQAAKEALLRRIAGGQPLGEIQALGDRFGTEVLPTLLRPGAETAIRRHQAAGHRCFLVTASLDLWTAAWARQMGLELIASRPEVVAGRLTGRLRGRNNHGPEKVRRLREALGDTWPDRLVAYGDSSGDRELLAAADEAHFKPFRSNA
ncbi:MAG: HAD-IB family hydrolase [Bacteroidetes bacterium]|nr:MAG: HAD-IB family hydrolase [Bacteroidota bacterium]